MGMKTCKNRTKISKLKYSSIDIYLSYLFRVSSKELQEGMVSFRKWMNCRK